MENAVDYYQSLLLEDKSPGVLLAKYFSELFSTPLGKENIIMMNKLVKLYGRQAVFEALTDSYFSGADPGRIFGLIHYICKKKTTEKVNIVNLSDYAKEFDKKFEAIKKVKIRNPFDD